MLWLLSPNEMAGNRCSVNSIIWQSQLTAGQEQGKRVSHFILNCHLHKMNDNCSIVKVFLIWSRDMTFLRFSICSAKNLIEGASFSPTFTFFFHNLDNLENLEIGRGCLFLWSVTLHKLHNKECISFESQMGKYIFKVSRNKCDSNTKWQDRKKKLTLSLSSIFNLLISTAERCS